MRDRATWMLTSVCALVLFVGAGAAAQGGLEVSFDDNGLRTLAYGDESFAEDPTFRVVQVRLATQAGGSLIADLSEERRSFDPTERRLTLAYAWGEVRCTYQREPDRLGLTIEVQNRGALTVAEIVLCPMETRFPQPPEGWQPHMPYRGFNLDAPTAVAAKCANTAVVVCNEDVSRPLQVGWAGRESLESRPMVVATSSDWMAEMLNPRLARPIHPGLSDRYEISLRFAPTGTDTQALTADIDRRFAEAHPSIIHWPDRRPIGALFLSSSDLGAPANPRGWFGDREFALDPENGYTGFRERLLGWARQSVEILQDLGCQGMITWDIEGQEHPHAISYLGDPRSLPPEMEAAVDDYFAVFRDAGLRTGVCVRPQIPVRSAYGDGVRQIEPPDPVANLDAKITYAKERWGCTLFYVDSNGDPNIPIPASVFRALAGRHPDVLLIPEHETAAYFACTPPYQDYANLGQLGTPDAVRRIYPKAFSFVYVGHGDPTPVREDLTEAVRRGDILVVHGWYRSQAHEIVKAIYASQP